MPGAGRLQHRPQRRVGGDAAGDHQQAGCVPGGELLHGVAGAIGQDLGDGALEAGGDVDGVRMRQRPVREAGDQVGDGGLEAGEAEVAARPPEQRPGQREALRVAAGGQFLQRRAAGPAETQQLRGLVERLADGVVDGAAEAPVGADALDRDALAMAAGQQQQQIRERRAAHRQSRQARGERVRLQVVHRDERQPARQRRALGEAGADDQPADQPRAGGGGDAGEVGVTDARFAHHAADQVGQLGKMRARGDFRHHSAIGCVAGLAAHRLGENLSICIEHCRCGVIAGGLDPQDGSRRLSAFHHPGLVLGHRHERRTPRPGIRMNEPVLNTPGMNRPGMNKPGMNQPGRHSHSLPLRVGTRGSPLALWQTRAFLGRLTTFCPVLRDMNVFEEHAIRTTGDAVQDRPLAEIGGKGLFAKEIHEALLDRRIDFAVHSLKDLETTMPDGIVLACTMRREDARDALILGPSCGPVDPEDPLGALPQGAVIGTSSVRRQAQLLHRRPDLRIGPLRGNVQTRLTKLRAAEGCDATLLALAGLRRLGLEAAADVVLDPGIMLPSAGQGIVGITVRADDIELRHLLAAIEDPAARAVSTAERALLAQLDGSCRTPIGGYARLLDDGGLHLTGLVARADGSFLLRRSLQGPAAEAEQMGAELGASLRVDSPRDIFA